MKFCSDGSSGTFTTGAQTASSFLHLLRVFFTGAFHAPRQFNWVIGSALFLAVLLSNFTGYLLPWDQLAFWAITICTGMLEYIPGIGVWLQELIQGGPEVGPGTLSRFYAIHTAILPALLLILLPFHFWRIRKAGGLVVPRSPGQSQEQRGHPVPAIPNLLLREVVAALVLFAFMLVFSMLFDAPLGSKANPGLSPNPTKAPWYFMGIHYRLDHSLRIPRPDLSEKIGAPNACNRCHIDKTTQWSVDAITTWYGPGRRPHYGTVIEAGRKRHPEAKKDLIRLAADPLYPVIVRSTALSLLTAYPGEDTVRAFELALMDDEALVRRTAVQSISLSGSRKRTELIAPLLYDPVAAVRMEAASALAGEPSKKLSPAQKVVFQAGLQEYMTSMHY